MNYFTSDLHFYHKRILEFCKRPYEDLDHMQEGLIANYNAIVKPEDTCYFLGDIFFCGTIKSTEILSRMNGTKRLIKGNHDRDLEAMLRIGFASADYAGEIKIGDEIVKMSHYPYKQDLSGLSADIADRIINNKGYYDKSSKIDIYMTELCEKGIVSKEKLEYLLNMDLRYYSRRFQDEGGWLLCGHMHDKWDQFGKMINVGVDVRNCKPISEDEIVAIMKAGPK